MQGKLNFTLFKNKWFQLICLFVICGCLHYLVYLPFEIKKHELRKIEVTVKELPELKNEQEYGRNKRGYKKLYFTLKEYQNKFIIYKGGLNGRLSKIVDALIPNRKIEIKIRKDDFQNLDNSYYDIPIYYLKESDSKVIFNVDDFNFGEKMTDDNVLLGLCFIFFIGFGKIFQEEIKGWRNS